MQNKEREAGKWPFENTNTNKRKEKEELTIRDI